MIVLAGLGFVFGWNLISLLAGKQLRAEVSFAVVWFSIALWFWGFK